MSTRLDDTRAYMDAMRRDRADAASPTIFDPEPKPAWQHSDSMTDQWRDDALAVVRRAAETRATFHVGDLAFPSCYDARAVGIILRRAAALGWVTNTGTYVNGGAERHGRPVVQWRSLLRREVA